MARSNSNSTNLAAAFRALHDTGCFIIPNPWDAGSAKYLQSLGFKALATTSAGFGFSQGLPDVVGAISREATLANVKQIVTATSLPVSADFQNGYADAPCDVVENVIRCLATGVAGLSIEDALGQSNQPLYEREVAVARIRAARAAIDSVGSKAVLTARCEAWLVSDETPFETAIDRLVAYAEAGADCLFAPGVRDPVEITAIVKAVSPKPLNVIVSSAVPGLSMQRLAELGVRRISVGSALARTAWAQFMRVSKTIAESGTFDSFADAASFGELNAIFDQRS